jgi:hypothetical protein
MCLKFTLVKLEVALDENNISLIKIYWFFASEKFTTQLKSAIIISESSFVVQKQQSANLMQIDIVSVT